MALQSHTLVMGALTDSVSDGENYVANQPIYIKNTSGTFADLYSDINGSFPIPQDGASNRTNSQGQFTFYVDAGEYIAEYNGQQTPITIVGSDYFNSRIDDVSTQIIIKTLPESAGNFTDGFTYNNLNEYGNAVVDDGAGSYPTTFWYVGGSLPHTVAPNTNPRDFPLLYQQRDFNTEAASSRSYDDIKDIYGVTDGRPVILTDSGVSRVGFIRVVNNHGLTGNDRNIKVIDSNTYWEAEGSDEQNARYRDNESVPLTITSLNAAFAEYVASTNRRKPRISPIVNEKVNRVMGSDYQDHVRPTDVGASSNSSIVFGSYLDYDDVAINPLFCFMAPIDNALGSISLSVTIESINGSDLDDLTVQWRVWDSYEKGSAQITAGGAAITRTGSTFSATAALNGTYAEGDLIGLHIVGLAGGGDYEITNASIIDDSGKVYSITREMKRSTVVTLAGEQSKRSVRISELNNGSELRYNGVKSGNVPSKIICTPEATNATGDTGANYSGTEKAGVYFDKGLTIRNAMREAQTMYSAGYSIPAIILNKGEYNSSGHLDFALNASEQTEWIIACPNGVATLSESVGGGVGLRLRGASNSVYPTFFLANIHCDNTLTIPFFWERVDVYGLNLKTTYADEEGFDIDYGNAILERCEASGSTNDGFNHHVRGHITLIDCKSYDNLDDGFSPHDDCTYEVFGGEYYGNGKANIIPAFGAKGFCVDVKSSGSTGLSPRVADVGYNDGGFVCLAYDGDQSTTMFLTSCTSEDDNNGIVSAGDNCFTYVYDTTVSNPTNEELVSNTWLSSGTGETGEPGVLVTNQSSVGSYSVIDENSLITSYNLNSFKWS